jgi:hypothetical protein
MRVYVSQDGGHTWQSFATPAVDVCCDLTIAPTNPQDLFLATAPCRPGYCGSSSSITSLYRTRDGGRHWSAWALPPVPSGTRRDFSWYWWAWVGSTFFLAPQILGERTSAHLAASIAGRPFVWVEGNGLLAGAPRTGVDLYYLLADATTLYAFLDCISPCTFAAVMRTRDNGASWSPYTPQFHQVPVIPDRHWLSPAASRRASALAVRRPMCYPPLLRLAEVPAPRTRNPSDWGWAGPSGANVSRWAVRRLSIRGA